MTSTRIISAVIFFAVFLLGLFNPFFFWIPPIVFAAAALWGIWEFDHFGLRHPPKSQLWISMLAGVALVADGYFFSLQHVVVIVGLLAVLSIGAGLILREEDVSSLEGKCVTGAIYVGLPLGIMMKLWQDNLNSDAEFPHKGAHYLLFLIFVTWANDTGAYFAGKAFGKRKIIPRISPGKTLEGYIGGFVLTVVVAVAIRAFWNNIEEILPRWFEAPTLALIFCLVAPLGDLAESQLKRSVHVKDSGETFTGHGGMLDIIDSILFTTIFYYLYLTLFHPEAFPVR